MTTTKPAPTYDLPEIESYGIGTHGRAVYLRGPGGTLKFWYSYQTCIAFAFNGSLTVRENAWSTTTGRHLAAIDGGSKGAKAARLTGEAFRAAFSEAMTRLGMEA